MFYLEKLKICPSCEEKSLLFCIIAERLSDRAWKHKLGVKCYNTTCSLFAAVVPETERYKYPDDTPFFEVKEKEEDKNEDSE